MDKTGEGWNVLHLNRAPVAHFVVHRAVTREVVSSWLRPDQHSGSLNNWGEKCCLCNFIYKWLEFLVFSDKDDKPEVPSHNSLNERMLYAVRRFWNQMKIWSSHLLDNLSNCLMNLKNSGDSTGFEPMTSAMPVQCSNQLSYEVTQWRAGQFVGLMFSRERNVVWKNVICSAVFLKSNEDMILALAGQFKQLSLNVDNSVGR